MITNMNQLLITIPSPLRANGVMSSTMFSSGSTYHNFTMPNSEKYSCSYPTTPLVMAKGEKRNTVQLATVDHNRPLANFHSTVWGNHFLSYTPQLTEISSQEMFERDELKEQVRQMLVETYDHNPEKLVLIDTIQRLGVSYHFESEIKTSIRNIFDASSQQKQNDDNLYVVALRFRLSRQHRHYMSPDDVFKKFTNQHGKFKEALNKDVHGLLSLYEAAHLRAHGEEILEEALKFSTTHLKFMLPQLSNSLKAQVSEALSQSIHTTVPRLGARKYICVYENIESHTDLLLKFAKLDFNILQKLHQQELVELTRWWTDLDYAQQFPYSRDRLAECYFWAVGVHFEPQHSRARKMLTKIINIYTMIDDTYDAYATYEELVPFTHAIDRWGSINDIDSVPPNLRPAFQALVDCYNEIEEELTKEDKLDRLNYAKYEMKRLVRAYLKEVEWLTDGYIPKCEEYMTNATVTITVMNIAVISCVGAMEESITKETFEWMKNKPLILRASSTINRLKDDIVGHEVEQQRTHVASFIECFMNEHGASKQEAYAEAYNEISDAWKDLNTEFLRPAVPMCVLDRIINLARLAYIMEEHDFGDTQSKFKDKITLLFDEPVN